LQLRFEWKAWSSFYVVMKIVRDLVSYMTVTLVVKKLRFAISKNKVFSPRGRGKLGQRPYSTPAK
jgi:hypothetical protein